MEKLDHHQLSENEINYARGFKDGWQAAMESQRTPAQLPTWPSISSPRGCPVCGLGADGKPMSYVCPRAACPNRVTAFG
jgi:hypothetical protein